MLPRPESSDFNRRLLIWLAVCVLVIILIPALGGSGGVHAQAATIAVANAPFLPGEEAEESIDGDVSTTDKIQAAATVATAGIALLGLGALIFGGIQLKQQKRQQRLQSGPYVRVDIGPTDEDVEHFRPPDPYFSNDDTVHDLAPGVPEESKVSVSAWFENKQSHNLGMALGVEAFFAAEVVRTFDSEPEYYFLFPRIAYLQQGNPVRLRLFSFPAVWQATVWLSHLTYYDLYDNRHVHSEGQSTNAAHGRLLCGYADGLFECVPEGWPRGDGVEYGEDDTPERA